LIYLKGSGYPGALFLHANAEIIGFLAYWVFSKMSNHIQKVSLCSNYSYFICYGLNVTIALEIKNDSQKALKHNNNTFWLLLKEESLWTLI